MNDMLLSWQYILFQSHDVYDMSLVVMMTGKTKQVPFDW